MDELSANLAHLVDVWGAEFRRRDFLDWVLMFGPLIFLEVPKYYLPLIGVVIAKWLGFPRVDHMRRAAFLRAAPTVSVVVAGRNEAQTIGACLRSLLDQDYPELEIIVVDDASTDDTYEVAMRYAKRGNVRVIRNREPTGRAGRPSASNLGMRLANGEFIVSVDADTTFDRRLIENMIAPFHDSRVGVVAGNLMARNPNYNMVTRFQTLEYLTSIDLHKRWTDLFGRTLQASGALGAFRRAAIQKLGGWDPELAEDGDISLRMIKDGWRIAFAPDGVASTDLPDTWGMLRRQRVRWDRGGWRTYFSKHRRLLRPSVAGWGVAHGMAGELLFSNLLPLLYPFYLVWLLTLGFPIFLFIMGTSWLIYTALSFMPVISTTFMSRRVEQRASLSLAALMNPFYREFLRWIKIWAVLLELLRVDYEDSYLPDSAWTQAPRF